MRDAKKKKDSERDMSRKNVEEEIWGIGNIITFSNAASLRRADPSMGGFPRRSNSGETSGIHI